MPCLKQKISWEYMLDDEEIISTFKPLIQALHTDVDDAKN